MVGRLGGEGSMTTAASEHSLGRKRLNPFAIVLFIVAVVIILIDIGTGLLVRPVIDAMAHRQAEIDPATRSMMFTQAMGQTIRGALNNSALLVAFGVLIELVDRILWRLTPGRGQ
jgi:hypothetical protein